MAPERMTQWPLFLRLSAVFTLAASAGLMVMSQAAGIMQAYGAGLGSALGATTLITAAIAAARIGGGWLIDRFALPHVMAAAQLWALCGAVLLSLWPSAQSALPGLAMIGMGYGLISGASAGAIAMAINRRRALRSGVDTPSSRTSARATRIVPSRRFSIVCG